MNIDALALRDNAKYQLEQIKNIESCAIIFEHNEPPENIIMAHEKVVTWIYYEKKWSDVSSTGRTVIETIEAWEKHCEEKGIKL